MIWKMMKRQRGEFLSMVICALIVESIFITMECLMQQNWDHFVVMGSIMSLLVMLIIYATGGITALQKEFNLGVAMGATRRSVMLGYAMVRVLLLVELVVLEAAGRSLEKSIITLIIKPKQLDDPFAYLAFLPLTFWIMSGIAIFTISLLIQTTIMRFGNNARFIILGIWLVLCILPGKIMNNEKVLAWFGGRKDWMIELLGSHTGITIVMMMGIPCVIVLVLCWMMLYKQRVE